MSMTFFKKHLVHCLGNLQNVAWVDKRRILSIHLLKQINGFWIINSVTLDKSH